VTDGVQSMPQLPISAIVLTKNEENGIAECIARLQDFDDIIVVDSHSDDNTVRLAEAAGARVIQFTWNGKYPKKKQWSLENAGAKHRWVLLLDADEYPTPELVAELRAMSPELESNEFGAYDIGLIYRFAGRFLRFGHRVIKRSLVDRFHAAFPDVGDLDAPGIREVEGHYQPQSTRRVGRLRGRLVHDDRDPVDSWFVRHNRYSSWEAHLLADSDIRRAVAERRSRLGRVWDRVPLKPAAFFGYSYVLRAGFLDGRAGLDYALALASYYWQIGVKHREAVSNAGRGSRRPARLDDAALDTLA